MSKVLVAFAVFGLGYFGEVTGITKLFLYACTFISLIYLGIREGGIYNQHLILLLSIAILGTISLSWTIDFEVSIDYLKKFIGILLILWWYESVLISAVDLVYIGKIFILNALLILLYEFFVVMPNLNREALLLGESEFNANAYAFYFIHALIGFEILGDRLSYWLKLVLLIGFVFLVGFYGSRTSTILFLIYFLFSLGKINKKYLIVIGAVLSFALFEVSWNKVSDTLLVFERVDTLRSHSSPRLYHFFQALSIGLESPLGIGFGAYRSFPKEIEMGSFTHNSYAELFSGLGWLGLVLYIIYQIKIFYGKPYFSLLLKLILIVYSVVYVSYLSLELLMAYSLVVKSDILIPEKLKNNSDINRKIIIT